MPNAPTPHAKPITVISYNLHKGMSPLSRACLFDTMIDRLAKLDGDVFCLQEVQGKYNKAPNSSRHNQDKKLDQLAKHCHYGKNATLLDRHHGNAIASKHVLEFCHNHNISVNRLEQRGLLHCRLRPDGWHSPLEILCTHLNLLHHDRIKQYQAIIDYIQTHINPSHPLILAGDFNDWQQKSTAMLSPLGLVDVFCKQKTPATFPARLPILSLDRIYIKNLKLHTTCVYHDKHWANLSDHLPISASVSLP